MSQVCLVAVDIRSTHNVGSFFRTCDCLGADIALVGITPRPKGDEHDARLPYVAEKAHRAIAKTALGAEETVAWRYFETIETAVAQLRTEGYRIVALEQSVASMQLNTLSCSTPIALLVGAEVDGLTERTLALCDEIYEIPMQGKKESLNVSVAAGIALYQATKC